MDCLSEISQQALSEKVSLSENDFIAWLKLLGLLFAQRICSCGSVMKEYIEKAGTRRRFCCNKRSCRKKMSFYEDTFFENNHLSPKETLWLSWFWCFRRIPAYADIQQALTREAGTKLSTRTLVNAFQSFRSVCERYFQDHPIVLGGPGKVVELDETMISGRKYHVGRCVDQQWVFGGVERGTNKCFAVLVERRDAATLLPVIQQHVAPGTTIVTDCWTAYRGIDSLPEGYQHQTVNHSRNFVDRNTGACTNGVESFWQKLKHPHKDRFGTSRDHLAAYLCELQWKRLFPENRFYHFWRIVREQYPTS